MSLPARLFRLVAPLVLSGLAATGCSAPSNPSSAASGTEPAPGETSGDEPGGRGPGSRPGAGSGSSTTGGQVTAPQPDKAGCAQTAYTEPLPTKASLSGVPFSSSAAQAFLLGALGARYPLGKTIVESVLGVTVNGTRDDCVAHFLHDTSSASSVLQQAGTVVHECGHVLDNQNGKGSVHSYTIRSDLKLACDLGDTTTRGGRTFARSRLRDDAFYALRPACGAQTKAGCDAYADTYLDGSDADSTFQSGDQGYNLLLEEAVQYVNSLATGLAFQDAYNRGTRVSERDGILTFLWYMERYVKMARERYKDAYALLSGDACWRQATLSVWDRGWFYLHATEGVEALGLDDAAIEKLATDPTLVAEIDALRTLECSP